MSNIIKPQQINSPWTKSSPTLHFNHIQVKKRDCHFCFMPTLSLTGSLNSHLNSRTGSVQFVNESFKLVLNQLIQKNNSFTHALIRFSFIQIYI